MMKPRPVGRGFFVLGSRALQRVRRLGLTECSFLFMLTWQWLGGAAAQGQGNE